MDVFEVLRQDHEKVRKLFSQIEANDGEQRESLFRQLKQELVAHTKSEEKAFYPALEKLSSTHDIIEEGLHEHHRADEILARIERMKVGSQDWQKTFHELRQCVEHHVQEEERELFPKARKVLAKGQVEDLAKQVEKAKPH